jgi:protein involved in sex pheromone biosynthesis
MKRLLILALTAASLLMSASANAHHDGDHKQGHQDASTQEGNRK